MNKISLWSLLCSALVFTACQTTPQQYNGTTGYQVEKQDKNSATIAYTLSVRPNLQLDEKKLQRACEQVLGQQRSYRLNILSTNEIANPKALQDDQYGVQIGKTRASFGFSNTPDMNNSADYATKQALETRPSTLQIVRYTCN